jgi:flavin-dependent dehydrogenase
LATRAETESFEVCVVGAGPAGAAAAIELARAGCRTLLIDAASGRGFRAGETLAGAAREPLAELGLEEWLDESEHLPSAAVASAWGSDELAGQLAITNPHGGGWHLDRVAFDSKLVDAAEAAGAKVWRDTRAAALRRAGKFHELEARCGKRQRAARVRFLIDSSGASRVVARKLGGSTEIVDRQVGLVAELKARIGDTELSPTLLLEATERGWWYSVPVPGRRAVAAFMSDADLVSAAGVTPREQWSNELLRAAHTRERLLGFSPQAVRVFGCGTSRLREPGGLGWAAVGDAAMVFDPLSSMGIAKALDSGLFVARSILSLGPSSTLRLEQYEQSCRQEFQAYLTTRSWFYTREQRWSGAPFWQRRHASPPPPDTSMPGAVARAS